MFVWVNTCICGPNGISMSRSRAYRRKQFPLPNDTDKKPYQTEIQKIRKKHNKKEKVMCQ